MENNYPRVIIDTNLWISFLITKNYLPINYLLISNKIKLVFSNELLSEFLKVTTRPKFQKYFSKSDLQILLELIDSHAEFIEVTSNIKICRDEKDNFLLSLATDSIADYLLTGDNDLLTLKNHGKTKIIPIGDLLKETF